MPAQYQAPSVKKAFQILRLVSQADSGLGISELAKRLGISKGTVHGIAAALEEEGAITRDPLTKRYTLGYPIVALGKKGLSRVPLRAIAKRHMEELVDQVGETAFLGILKDEAVFILDVVECAKELKITSPPGTELPLSAGATGKLFLAHMDLKSAQRTLDTKGLVRYTENSITDIDDYLEELRNVKKNGYAVDREEYLQGVRAVAALVKTEGNPLVAIWIVGFSSALSDDRLEKISQKTVRTAEAISQDLKHK